MINDSSLLLVQLRRITVDADSRSDRELLERFAAGAGEDAFAELVRRHGPMVLRVCRRVLAEPADAEDAFQATFLVLARKAGAVRGRDSVAGFLYAVARNISRRARDAATRRARHEGHVHTAAPAEPPAELTARELFAALDEELGRLSEKLRAPLVLCHLEGLTRDEAARRLGCPLGTLKDRLEHGKKRLREALTRRGVSVPAALGVLLAASAAQAGLPATWAEAAVQSALAPASSRAGATLLARAALAPPLLARRALAALLLVGSAIASGVAFWPPRPRAEPDFPLPTAQPATRVDRFGDPLPDGAIVRLGTTRLAHAGLACYRFLDGGKTILSIGSDRVLRSWDVATGRQVGEVRLEVKGRMGQAATLSPDGKTLAGLAGPNIVFWEVATGKSIKTLPAPKGDLASFLFSPDGKELIATMWTPEVILIDWQKGNERRLALPQRKIGMDSTFHTCLSPDGRWLVAGGGWDSPLCIFDRAAGSEVRRLRCNALTSAMSPDSKTLVVCERTEGNPVGKTTLRFLELPGGAEVSRFALGHDDSYFSLAFTPDGKTIACGFSDRSLVMECASGRKKFSLPGRPICLSYSPDGKTLAASTGQRIRLWDAATGKERHEFPGELGWIPATAISPDGRLLAAADWLDRSVSLWDLTTGRLVRELPLKGETRYVRDLHFSPDGRTLSAAQYKGFLQSWDTATGLERRTVQLDDPARENPEFTYFFHLHLSPDARRIATLQQMIRSESTRLAVWDAATGKLLRQQELPPQARTCAWSAEGTTVALLLPDGLRLVEVDSGTERFRVPGTSAGGPLASSPDDRLLAARRPAGGKNAGPVVGIWEAATGKQVAAVAAACAGHLALAADARHLITTDNRCLRVWDLATGKECLCLALPLVGSDAWDTFVTALVLTPDGQRAVTALVDGTALVWDLATAPKRIVPTEPSAKELAEWWADLAQEDAAKAYLAVWRLTEVPQAAQPLLRRYLRPTTDADLAEARRLIADLDADEFAVREKAVKRLESLGDGAASALRETLAKGPSPEVRRRAEQLLEAWRTAPPSGDRLRLLRALAVLEHARTPEARQLLEELARGLTHACQTEQARAALARLDGRGR
jgi:RNA polymerase sigma factor (sigma-70 family)